LQNPLNQRVKFTQPRLKSFSRISQVQMDILPKLAVSGTFSRLGECIGCNRQVCR